MIALLLSPLEGFISYVDDRRNRVTDMGRKSLIESTVLGIGVSNFDMTAFLCPFSYQAFIYDTRAMFGRFCTGSAHQIRSVSAFRSPTSHCNKCRQLLSHKLKFVIIGTLPCQLYIIYYVLIRIQLA